MNSLPHVSAGYQPSCPSAFVRVDSAFGVFSARNLVRACLTQVFRMDGWPWALPAACQPSLQRGVRGVSHRLKKRSASLPLPRSLSLWVAFCVAGGRPQSRKV